MIDKVTAWNQRQETVSALEFIFFMAISALVGFLVGLLTILVFE